MDFKELSKAQDVGQTAGTKHAVDAYDDAMGTFDDALLPPGSGVSTEEKLPMKQLPKAPDPSPFKLRG